jgi:hypothetical protein
VSQDGLSRFGDGQAQSLALVRKRGFHQAGLLSDLPRLALNQALMSFKKGDRVKMTARAIQNRLDGPRHITTGTVTGFSRDGKFLRVQRDGIKETSGYAPIFWELA